MDMTPQTWPDWYDGRHINEVLFCQQFLEKHPMKCVRGRLFTVDGLIEDEGQIGNLILEEISGVLTANLSKTVANLLASIKLQTYSPPLPIETDRIHVANGTYFMDGRFTADKSYCNNRLTVTYNPDAPTPKRWLQFLSELLQPEDIPTLQEFLGYCLLPTTKGQKMLMLIGKGGEGKSRIGLVMRSLLGDSMNTTSIQKVESNRFSRADLENKLLMVDDDMDKAKLTILKEAARTLNYLTENNLLQYADLEKKVEDVHGSYDRTGKELKGVEAQLREVQPLIKNISNYQRLKPVYVAFQKAKDKQSFKAKHEAELVIFEAARSTLLAMQGDEKLPSLKTLQAEQQRLLDEQQRLYDERAKLKKEVKQIETIKSNVDTFLSPSADHDRDHLRSTQRE